MDDKILYEIFFSVNNLIHQSTVSPWYKTYSTLISGGFGVLFGFAINYLKELIVKRKNISKYKSVINSEIEEIRDVAKLSYRYARKLSQECRCNPGEAQATDSTLKASTICFEKFYHEVVIALTVQERRMIRVVYASISEMDLVNDKIHENFSKYSIGELYVQAQRVCNLSAQAYISARGYLLGEYKEQYTQEEVDKILGED
ncbi:hypothetical protein PTT65_17880 [Serratia ureilytica]|uniref:hypothetical protein n=1 Tax=Serratia ureilytica TaxID=300181 RepID=UPI00313F0279